MHPQHKTEQTPCRKRLGSCAGILLFKGRLTKKTKRRSATRCSVPIPAFFAANQKHELLFLRDETYPAFFTGVALPVDGGFSAYSGV